MNEIEKCISKIVSECNKDTVITCIDQDMTSITPNEKSCEWVKREEIGHGQKGVVYSICCNDNCNYIIKVIKFEKNTDKDAFLNEVNIQQQFYNYGFAPRIIAACYCKHEGVIVMEKVQLLGSYLESIPSDQRRKIWDDLNRKYVEKYKYMLTEKELIHNDTNPGNIALSLDGKKPLMIDFGLSRKTTNKDDLFELINDFKMSLNLVRDGIKGTVVERKPTKTHSRVSRHVEPVRQGLFDNESSTEDYDDKFRTPSPSRKAGIRRGLFE